MLRPALGLVVISAALSGCKTGTELGAESSEVKAVSSEAEAQCHAGAQQAAAQFVLPFKKKKAYDAYYTQCMAANGGGGDAEDSDADPVGENNSLPLVRNRTIKAAQQLKAHLGLFPAAVRQEAECIAVIAKDTIGWGLSGGSIGAGLVSCRHPSGGWSAPSYMSLGAVTLGPSVGFMNTDTTVIFARNTANEIRKTQVDFSAQVYAVAGDHWVEAKADTDGCFLLKVFNTHKRGCTISITDVTGLAAGANVEGVLLRHMNGPLGNARRGRNARVYGKFMTSDKVFALPSSQAPEVAQPWVEVLNHLAP